MRLLLIVFAPFIFVSTVYSVFVYVQVKHQNLGVYRQVRDLISNPSKRFYVFANEHHRETFIERERSESANDRNDKSIRTAVKWYSQHLVQGLKTTNIPKVILLTNDRENREKAKALNLSAHTVYEYAKSLVSHPLLVDRLAKFGGEGDSELTATKKFLYPEHLPLSVIQSGLKSGKFLQGVFQNFEGELP